MAIQIGLVFSLVQCEIDFSAYLVAWLCSTPELVAAYKSACESVGVKPLKKLLVQLEVRAFHSRSRVICATLRYGEPSLGRVRRRVLLNACLIYICLWRSCSPSELIFEESPLKHNG